MLLGVAQDDVLAGPGDGRLLDGRVNGLEEVGGKVGALVEAGQVLGEVVAGHLPEEALAVEVRVEQHDGAGERVDGVLGGEDGPLRRWVAGEVAAREVKEHPLPLL